MDIVDEKSKSFVDKVPLNVLGAMIGIMSVFGKKIDKKIIPTKRLVTNEELKVFATGFVYVVEQSVKVTQAYEHFIFCLRDIKKFHHAEIYTLLSELAENQQIGLHLLYQAIYSFCEEVKDDSNWLLLGKRLFELSSGKYKDKSKGYLPKLVSGYISAFGKLSSLEVLDLI